MVWFAATICSTAITYFFIPETTKLSLEEIGGLFGDEVVTHMTADGHGLKEVDNLDDIKTPGSSYWNDGTEVVCMEDVKTGPPQTPVNAAEP